MDNQKNDELVYFYCSLNSFKEIIHNRSLFLSDLHYMNDSTEESLFLSAFEETVKKEIENLPEPQKQQLKKDEWYMEYLNNISEIFTNAAFICCFSKRPDDLSQWRGYGDDAKGLCIGFDKKALEKIEIKKSLYIKDVIYSTKEEIVKELSPEVKKRLKIASDEFEEYVKFRADESMSDEKQINQVYCDAGHQLFMSISKALCEISINKGFYKNFSFESEAEFRMCFYDKLSFEAIKKNLLQGLVGNMNKTYTAVIQDKKIADLSEVKYRTANGMLIPYREMKFKDFFPEIVKSITIGPKSKVNINELKRFLAYEGLKVEEEIENVTLSTSTYR